MCSMQNVVTIGKFRAKFLLLARVLHPCLLVFFFFFFYFYTGLQIDTQKSKEIIDSDSSFEKVTYDIKNIVIDIR